LHDVKHLADIFKASETFFGNALFFCCFQRFFFSGCTRSAADDLFLKKKADNTLPAVAPVAPLIFRAQKEILQVLLLSCYFL
jgi:hypothetical protein